MIGVLLELEAVDVLGQRQLRDGQLVLDRARLLLRDLSLEQIAREALRFMPTFDRRGEDLVIGVLHPEQPELAHQIEDFGSLHASCAPEPIVSGAIGDRRVPEPQRIRRENCRRRAGVALAGEDVDDHIG